MSRSQRPSLPPRAPCRAGGPLALLTLALTMALAFGCGSAPEPAEPEGELTLLTGPRFWTGDPERPFADGVLVSEGIVVELLEREQIGAAAARAGTMRNLPGALAVPGLVDAHGHLLGFGMTHRQVDLVGAASIDEALERVREYASAHPDDTWILGRGWDQNDWPGGAWPDADRLDQVVPGRPVALSRVDGHALWVNRAALAEAGIDAETADPPGGKIHRDAGGRPTGVLIDTAMELVTEVVPEPGDAEVKEALELAGRELAALGLVGMHDMGIDERTWRILRELAEEGRFPLRISAYASEGSALAERLLSSGPQRVGRLELLGVKLFADGALGSRGARLLEPYADAPGTRGLWLTEPEELERRVAGLVRAGLQPAVHAIGDAGNRAVLDAFAAAYGAPLPEGPRDEAAARPRLEHAQVLDPDDLARLPALSATIRRATGGVGALVVSMQPTHATSDMPWAEARLGPERLAGAYAWRSVLDMRLPLALGSDFPVESADPRLGLYAAVTRQDLEGRPPGGWRPEERISIEEALAGFSSAAAFAAGAEDERGRLVPGQSADMTIFAQSPFSATPGELAETPVAGILVEGELIGVR